MKEKIIYDQSRVYTRRRTLQWFIWQRNKTYAGISVYMCGSIVFLASTHGRRRRRDSCRRIWGTLVLLLREKEVAGRKVALHTRPTQYTYIYTYTLSVECTFHVGLHAGRRAPMKLFFFLLLSLGLSLVY